MRITPRTICISPHGLDGLLTVPPAVQGLALFAHGSGSSRFSPRNTFVAEGLQAAGIGTLLFDLLTAEEAGDRANVFNIPLLAQRLVMATDWIAAQDKLKDLPLGYFGASTGAAAALVASVETPHPIRAIVSRGGRPDLALPVLPRVKAATLLIVGGRDYRVIELNQQALAVLSGDKAIEIVPGATHLFEEPGTLEQVIGLARRWFGRYLRKDQEAG
jgi:dienelactone hydrolase